MSRAGRGTDFVPRDNVIALATSRLVGQTLGAALVALCFGLSLAHGATLALSLGAAFAALGAAVSFSRLAATPFKAGQGG